MARSKQDDDDEDDAPTGAGAGGDDDDDDDEEKESSGSSSPPIVVPPAAVNPNVGPTSTAPAPAPPPIAAPATALPPGTTETTTTEPDGTVISTQDTALPARPGAPAAKGTLTPPPEGRAEYERSVARLKEKGLEPDESYEQWSERHGVGAVAPAPTEKPTPAYGTRGGSTGAPVSTALPGTATSPEKPEILSKPGLNPNPWNWVQKQRPEVAEAIRFAAQKYNVTPERIAAHAYAEGSFNPNTKRGGSGEIGMMQIMPSTASGENLSENGRYNINDWRDNIMMGAKYMAALDGRYGRDSVNSVRHYNGSGPKSWGYVTGKTSQLNFFPGAGDFSPEIQAAHEKGSSTSGRMTARGLVDASKQGPDSFQNYVVNWAGSGKGMTDAYLEAQNTLVEAALRRGDYAGAQHARDMIFQQSHAGTNQYLMAAYQALQRGDGVGAANLLAKGHGFFPDGKMGRFRSDGKNVWAESMDEDNPTQRIGSPQQITPQDIMMVLTQTQDPQKYFKFLTEQQKQTAIARRNLQQGSYAAAKEAQIPVTSAQRDQELADRNLRAERKIGSTEGIKEAERVAANAREAARIAAANARQQSRNEKDIDVQILRDSAAMDRAILKLGPEGMKPDATHLHNVDNELADNFNPPKGATPEQQAASTRQATTYKALRGPRNELGFNAKQSADYARGIDAGTLTPKVMPDGSVHLIDKDKKLVQRLPGFIAQRLTGGIPDITRPRPTSSVGAATPPPTAMPRLGATPPPS